MKPRDASAHRCLGVADFNSARLPHFARLDARVTYRPARSGERWAFYLDFLNVLLTLEGSARRLSSNV